MGPSPRAAAPLNQGLLGTGAPLPQAEVLVWGPACDCRQGRTGMNDGAKLLPFLLQHSKVLFEGWADLVEQFY